MTSCFRALGAAVFLLASGALAQTAAVSPVGVRQVEHADSTYGPRTLTMNVFYPARAGTGGPAFAMPMFTNVDATRDAEIAPDAKFPLIMLSHGRGSTGLVYAWLAAHLASRGYVVATIDHWRANVNDRSIVYVASKLWQRPVDVRLDITYLVSTEPWKSAIDAERIGIAGHSQGGFTALWIGGARVNAERFAQYQRRWKNDLTIPAHIREEMPVDPAPASNVADPRVKAAMAMAPGVVQAFGMDAEGLGQMRIPALIVVGAGDTVTPPRENAIFAADHIRNVDLVLLSGPVGHEIFVNECTSEGRLELPETCIDSEGVDRAKLHAQIADHALRFFERNLRNGP